MSIQGEEHPKEPCLTYTYDLLKAPSFVFFLQRPQKHKSLHESLVGGVFRMYVLLGGPQAN